MLAQVQGLSQRRCGHVYLAKTLIHANRCLILTTCANKRKLIALFYNLFLFLSLIAGIKEAVSCSKVINSTKTYLERSFDLFTHV